jgi:TrbL/VirB6 plasmid conjugal transfer protein
MISLSWLMETLWTGLRGAWGTDFVAVYTSLGAILWGFLLFKVFLQEGLQVAMGHRSELPRILVKYLFIAGMFGIWPILSSSLFRAVQLLAVTFFPDLNEVFNQMAGGMAFMQTSTQAAENSQGLAATILGSFYNLTFGAILSMLGVLIFFLCYVLIFVNIAGSITVLALNLVLGPVFFALAFDRDFRGHSQRWLAATLSYILLMPLYGAALRVAASIAGAAIPAPFGLPSVPQMLTHVIGPILAVGVVFSTNRVVNALIGGAAGSGAGSTALGVAGIAANLIPAGALVRTTGAATGAAARKGAGAAQTVGSKLSTTGRAALGK